MLKILICILLLAGFSNVLKAETPGNSCSVLLAYNDSLHKLTVCDDAVTSNVVTTLPDVSKFSLRMPTSDEELALDAKCLINSRYLHAVSASGVLFVAFDKELVIFGGEPDMTKHLKLDGRIVSLAAGEKQALAVVCDLEETRLNLIEESGKIMQLPVPARAEPLRAVAMAADDNMVALVSDKDKVFVADYHTTLSIRQEFDGTDAMFLTKFLLIKNGSEGAWHTVSRETWLPTGGRMYSKLTRSPDGEFVFRWDGFCVDLMSELIWLRPVTTNQSIVSAAFTWNNKGLYVLSRELPEYAGNDGPQMELRFFDLESGDVDGKQLWKSNTKVGRGAGVWVVR